MIHRYKDIHLLGQRVYSETFILQSQMPFDIAEQHSICFVTFISDIIIVNFHTKIDINLNRQMSRHSDFTRTWLRTSGICSNIISVAWF